MENSPVLAFNDGTKGLPTWGYTIAVWPELGGIQIWYDAAWKKCADKLPVRSSLQDDSGRLDLTGEKMLDRGAVPAS